MAIPPIGSDHQPTTVARETIFVIDTSGSMSGTSIEQAKAALLLALNRLTAQDRFNVIQFNSVTHVLFSQAQPVTPQTLRKALHYVDNLRANGGTEILPALKMALKGSAPASHLRQVIFLTDGQVGNGDELFEVIRTHLGASRLFTIGIGSAPNSHFMRKAAEFGRGTFTHIGMGLYLSQKSRLRHQGILLSVSVVGFGLATVLFGVSTFFWLTMLALILVGAFDGLSSIIRNTVRQLLTPDSMRGRMMSITQIFFKGGPQLGEVESGLVAQILGVPFAII